MSVLYLVTNSIPPTGASAFDRWAHDEFVPRALAQPGTVAARRYRAVGEDDDARLLTTLEFQDEASFRRFLASEAAQELRREQGARFPMAVPGEATAWAKVWPRTDAPPPTIR